MIDIERFQSFHLESAKGKKTIALILFNNVNTTENFVAVAKGKNLSR